MKKIYLTLIIILIIQIANAQNTPWSTNGNIGIGTTTPAALFSVGSSSQFQVQGNGVTTITIPVGSEQATLFAVINGTNNGYTTLAASGASSVVPTWVNGSQIMEFVPYSTGNGVIGTYTGSLKFQTNNRTDRMIIDINGNVFFGGSSPNGVWNANGSVGINTTYISPGYQLAVNGSLLATAVTVQLRSAWPDYVFKKDFLLPSLADVKIYIDKNQHLPDVPSAQEIEKNGLDLGEMNKILMRKVEELTLYIIEKDKQISMQKMQITEQQTQLDEQNNINQKQLAINQVQQAQIDLLIKQVAALTKN